MTWAAVLVALVLLSAPLGAQWLNVPRAAIPRTADGQPNLRAPTSRLPNGTPDLTGIWRSTDNKYLRDLAADMNPDDVPYQPWARALFDARKNGAHSRGSRRALPAAGSSKIDSVAYPWKIIQTPISYVIVYETFTYWRQIFTDGRTVNPDANPTWMGYSTGRWEGDTFVVDTRGFNGKAWLNQLGRPGTDRLHVVERFTRPDFGRLIIDVTIDDPGAYTRPWTVSTRKCSCVRTGSRSSSSAVRTTGTSNAFPAAISWSPTWRPSPRRWE